MAAGGGIGFIKEVSRVELDLIDEWIQEVVDEMPENKEKGAKEVGSILMNGEAVDDVNGKSIPVELVREARKEEVGFMKKRNLWEDRTVKECWEKTGKAPVTVRWVDVMKPGETLGEWLVRSRLVARDFKGEDKDRDDLFAETPPLEAKRMLFSRAATRREDGRWRKLMFIDVRKAHLNPRCEQDVYIDLPKEASGGEGQCGK